MILSIALWGNCPTGVTVQMSNCPTCLIVLAPIYKKICLTLTKLSCGKSISNIVPCPPPLWPPLGNGHPGRIRGVNLIHFKGFVLKNHGRIRGITAGESGRIQWDQCI